jgi:hypothetical protein
MHLAWIKCGGQCGTYSCGTDSHGCSRTQGCRGETLVPPYTRGSGPGRNPGVCSGETLVSRLKHGGQGEAKPGASSYTGKRPSLFVLCMRTEASLVLILTPAEASLSQLFALSCSLYLSLHSKLSSSSSDSPLPPPPTSAAPLCPAASPPRHTQISFGVLLLLLILLLRHRLLLRLAAAAQPRRVGRRPLQHLPQHLLPGSQCRACRIWIP